MEQIITICTALSVGIAGGVAVGALKARLNRNREYSEKRIASYQRFWKSGSTVLAFITGAILAVGLIWTVGFLVLAALYPDQADYANNMSELIVGVLTVVSIIFAFFEFLRRK